MALLIYCLMCFQFWRGTLKQAQREFEERNPRGEMTLVIEGLAESAANELPSEEDVKIELRVLLNAGVSPSEVLFEYRRRT